MTSLTLEKAVRRANENLALINLVLSMHSHRDRKGYRWVFAPWFNRHNRAGWAKRANVIASIWFGRSLQDAEIVHHRDGNKDNDSPQNLEIIEYGEHSRIEVKARWEAGKMKGACKNGRWSKRHESCVKCKTIERRHQGRGLCSLCYQRIISPTSKC